MVRVAPGVPREAASDADALVDAAVELAASWLRAAHADVRPAERRLTERLLGVIADPGAVAFTMRFVDRVARHRSDHAAAAQLASLVHHADLPPFLSALDRVLLRAGATLAPRLPTVVMPLARRRLRQLVGHLVVDAEPAALHDHLATRRQDGFDLNVNLLGELVLGEQEARRRFDGTLALIDDPTVDYLSVKISSIASQLDLWSFDTTLQRVVERLRDLFVASGRTRPPTFVNLDMEEYRDLELTLQAFMTLLDEPALERLDAGIVLQAYLPEALDSVQRLTDWAISRHARTGAAVKIRLVKGANLAMERVDAAIHGWHQAPYTSKADVDANYKRCLDWMLTDERTAAVRVGVASHNLFDVAWAHLLAEARGVTERVEIEMLHGIAPSQARAVRRAAGGLRLYTPIVGRRDFDIAIGYLFRRLEENAAPENFLRHLFTLEPGSHEFDVQADRFRTAVATRHTVDTTPRRTRPSPVPERFDNEPDTDPSLPATQRWLSDLRVQAPRRLVTTLTTSVADVDRAVASARAAAPRWHAIGAAERRAILRRAADELAARRGELLVTMMHEGRKTFAEADPEVSEAIDFARWYADRGLEIEHLQHTEALRYRPLGVVAVVPPWNFPVAIPAGGVLAALAAGNAVVFKPSLETPACAEIVASACWAVGVPRAVLQFVRTPDDHIGRHLVSSVDGVVLTGSWATAELFRGWRPDIRLFAETSGKNAIVVTPQADYDLAAADVVRSAFGHSGQKCSAASLAILVGAVHDDERFRAKLVDAARSLRVGWPTESGVTLGPVITPASGKLLSALTELAPGERWLLEPRRLDAEGALWSPGIKEGVASGSMFHRTECFGPVLGVMRAADLTEAVALQNAVDYGLTGGIHSLDPDEVERWLATVEVGNAYVNRHITGAVVRRQPFGGWKRSSIGPGAKAGGFDYLLQLGHWIDADPARGDAWLDRAAASDRWWWASHYGAEHDPSGLFCESNVLRYRPRPSVMVRLAADADPLRARRTIAAARTAGAEPLVSQAPGADPVDEAAHVEDDEAFAGRVRSARWARVRVVGTAPAALHAAAREAEADVVDAPVVASGRLELRWYVREQSVSRTLHRFGNVLDATRSASTATRPAPSVRSPSPTTSGRTGSA